MTLSRPYLIRTLYEWLLENDDVPFLIVDAQLSQVKVPQSTVKNGQVTLSIGPSAVQSLAMNNHAISFVARFGGGAQDVYIPILAVMAIVGKNTNQGMVFGHEPGFPHLYDTDADINKKADTTDAKIVKKPSKSKATLRVIK